MNSMFNFKHYVPIVRWKAAEKEALQQLEAQKKAFITPVIELIMPRPKTYKVGSREKSPQELLTESISRFRMLLPKIPQEISKYWGTLPVFIDVNLLDISLRADTLRAIMQASGSSGLSLIPVITLVSDDTTRTLVISEAQKCGRGFCLRLFRSDVADPISLQNRIRNLLNSTRTNEGDVDLLVDFQIADQECSKISSLTQSIPDIMKWRTFTFASGAFPIDLVPYSPPNRYDIDRADWCYWSSQLSDRRLMRKPSFGDYTIQHPIYKEPARGANPSASIRYALNEKWMIMRGQALRSSKSAGYAQYPAQAQLVLKQQEFFGENFSYGDGYIARIGKDIKNKETGNPRTWLRAGINHHLTCVVTQISNLP